MLIYIWDQAIGNMSVLSFHHQSDKEFYFDLL